MTDLSKKAQKIGKIKGGYPSQFAEKTKHVPELQPDMWVKTGHLDKNWEIFELKKQHDGLVTPSSCGANEGRCKSRLYS